MEIELLDVAALASAHIRPDARVFSQPKDPDLKSDRRSIFEPVGVVPADQDVTPNSTLPDLNVSEGKREQLFWSH